jgi:hypothetical protein
VMESDDLLVVVVADFYCGDRDCDPLGLGDTVADVARQRSLKM